jgi:hypothetical protein
MKGQRCRTAGDLTGERKGKGKVPEARARDVGKGKEEDEEEWVAEEEE